MKNNIKHQSSPGFGNLTGFLLHINRLLLGAVFIFSGFVKAVDPLGTVYKIEDYLHAFGGFFNMLIPLAYPAAVILISIELLIGLSLLFQVRIKLFSWIALLFMLVMTPLTLYIAIHNPVTDCGCFGDAVRISNKQTFYKNIILLSLTLILLIYQKKINRFSSPKIEWGFVCFFIVLASGLMAYNLSYLPILDFRPYKIGVNIPESMKVPANAPKDVYESSFIYEKDGIIKTFSLEALPDSTWTFIRQETKLISEGYKPPIHDLVILTAEFEDVTKEVLEYKGTSYLIIMYDLDKTSATGLKNIKNFTENQNIKNPEAKIYALTASSSEKIQQVKQTYGLTFPFYKADPITLKTMIRANPGVIKTLNGTIQEKWNGKQIFY